MTEMAEWPVGLRSLRSLSPPYDSCQNLIFGCHAHGCYVERCQRQLASFRRCNLLFSRFCWQKDYFVVRNCDGMGVKADHTLRRWFQPCDDLAFGSGAMAVLVDFVEPSFQAAQAGRFLSRVREFGLRS
jgi:hypothetical protein